MILRPTSQRAQPCGPECRVSRKRFRQQRQFSKGLLGFWPADALVAQLAENFSLVDDADAGLPRQYFGCNDLATGFTLQVTQHGRGVKQHHEFKKTNLLGDL
jgi:hypothetical protein